MIGMAVFCFALFPFLRLYAPQRGVTLFEEVRRLINAWLLMAAAWFAFLFLSKSGPEFSRVWSIYWIASGFAVHLAFRGRHSRRAARTAAARLQPAPHRHRRRGQPWPGNRRAARADALERTCRARLLRRQPGAPWHIHQRYSGARPDGRRLIDDLDLEHRSTRCGSRCPCVPKRASASCWQDLRRHSVQVRFVPDIFNFTLLHHSMSEIAGLPVINLTESPLEGVNRVHQGRRGLRACRRSSCSSPRP